jgi:cystathionine beta-synthase
MPDREVVTAELTDTVRQVVEQFKAHGISQVPVVDEGRLAGILTEADVLQRLFDGRAEPETSVAKVMVRTVSTINMKATTSDLLRIFERGEVAVVVDGDHRVQAILTKMDLIELLASRRTCAPD